MSIIIILVFILMTFTPGDFSFGERKLGEANEQQEEEDAISPVYSPRSPSYEPESSPYDPNSPPCSPMGSPSDLLDLDALSKEVGAGSEVLQPSLRQGQPRAAETTPRASDGSSDEEGEELAPRRKKTNV
ncbi:hypothetical protein CYMTET_49553 [Cymbomonas tetramitiformis]|uniref:Uncharacterized protein n=1 Tax=Cymbomonas tetramitiformis TaxID=36881 RepID=A0AAE0BPZ4_9CHLO|nr:hypothetical protein CYMTET_49553 [Cymbomonas tetramitiformis]